MPDIVDQIADILVEDHVDLLAKNKALRDENEQLRAYQEHHEFVIAQIEHYLGSEIKTLGDLLEAYRKLTAENERLRALLERAECFVDTDEAYQLRRDIYDALRGEEK